MYVNRRFAYFGGWCSFGVGNHDTRSFGIILEKGTDVDQSVFGAVRYQFRHAQQHIKQKPPDLDAAAGPYYGGHAAG